MVIDVNKNEKEKISMKEKESTNFGYTTSEVASVAATKDSNVTTYHGEEVYAFSNYDKKGVRAFIFEGMDDSNESLDILTNIQKYCSGPMFVWDHSRITIRKVTYYDYSSKKSKANFRVEFLRLNVASLRRFAKILKASGAISTCYEDIHQKKNAIA